MYVMNKLHAHKPPGNTVYEYLDYFMSALYRDFSSFVLFV